MLFRTLLGLLAAAHLALSAKLDKVADFGANPSKINMYIYVPDKVAAKPAIIVAVSDYSTNILLPLSLTRLTIPFLDAPLRRLRHKLVQWHAVALVRR